MEPIVHYPAKEIKYMGSINPYHGKETTFKVAIITRDIRYSKTLKTYDEALEHLKEKNKEFNLPIKNIIYEYPSHMEVELTSGMKMKFNKQKLDLVESYCWFNDRGYASTRIGPRIIRFHNMVLEHKPGDLTVDHINKNPLDNQCENLRLADTRIQIINQNISTRNKTGIRGVSYIASRDSWKVTWSNEDGRNCSKNFACKKFGHGEAKAMAVAHRKNIEETIPHYRTALAN